MNSPKRDREFNRSFRRVTSRHHSFEPLENRTLLSVVPPLSTASDELTSQAALVESAEVSTSQSVDILDFDAINQWDTGSSQSVGTLDFAIVNQWNTGFQASLVLTNTSGQDWTSWTVQFDLPHGISSIWNTVIESQDGNRFTIVNTSWNASLANGQSVTLGFIGTLVTGTSPQTPTNIVINNATPSENAAPTPADDVVETQAGDPVIIDFLFNDTDPDGDPVSLVDWSSPKHGTVAQDADGRFVYTPADGFVGDDSFEYTVTDGQDTASATVSIQVKPADPVNNDPLAVDDTANTTKDTAVSIDVLGNDVDDDGDPLAVVDWTAPSHGTVTLSTDGRLLYTPEDGFVGTDVFTYTMTDGSAAASATVRVSVTDPTTSVSAWPDRFYAPYLDATLPGDYNMAEAAETLGVKYFTLAFIVADPTTSQPSWGGYYDFDSGYRMEEIEALRDLGGDVMISFGGATGTELAVAITDTDALTAAYQSVIDEYSLTTIDFDIEGAWVNDSASVDRRSEAIARLQAAATAEGRTLDVWFTLPVLPTGLVQSGIDLVESALSHGVDIAGINIMTMDYGDGAAPNPDGQMGEYAIQAAQSLHSQLKQLYADAGIAMDDAALWQKVGITPMIGQNDIASEVFDLEDAQQVLDFAYEMNIGMIGMWSVNRDSGGSGLSNYHSGITQEPGEFQTIFAPYTGDLVPAISISDAQVVESDGTTEIIFTVQLSQVSDSPVTVRYATTDGTAAAGSDYEAAAGLITFAPGETEHEIRVLVTGDRTVELDETMGVVLSEAEGATLRNAQAVGTILDDDAPPSVTIHDATIVEGDSGRTVAEFLVELSRDLKTGETVTVHYSTQAGSADADDFVPVSGVLTFNPGTRVATIAVEVFGDTTIEPEETFQVSLENAVGATIGSGTAVGTIEDDDAPLGEVALTVGSNWGTGHIGHLELTNTTDTNWSGWRLTFRYAFEITNIWNARIVSHVGDLYVIEPVSWTQNMAAGGSVSIGFEASGPSELGWELIDPTLFPVD